MNTSDANASAVIVSDDILTAWSKLRLAWHRFACGVWGLVMMIVGFGALIVAGCAAIIGYLRR